jgi:hypothetical protein
MTRLNLFAIAIPRVPTGIRASELRRSMKGNREELFPVRPRTFQRRYLPPVPFTTKTYAVRRTGLTGVRSARQ